MQINEFVDLRFQDNITVGLLIGVNRSTKGRGIEIDTKMYVPPFGNFAIGTAS